MFLDDKRVSSYLGGKTMDYIYDMLEFGRIIEQLKEYAYTDKAKEKFQQLRPYTNEKEILIETRDTTEARKILDTLGTPPMVSMKDIRKIVEAAERSELLSVEELEKIRQYAVSCKRLKSFLLKSIEMNLNISSYGAGIDELEVVRAEIENAIRGGRVDDYASKELRDIRRKMENVTSSIKQKLENLLRSKKDCFSESFVSNRNGHFTLPVKKECKFQISGSVIDTSSSGATYFIEPTIVSKLKDDLAILELEENNEVRKILYTLTNYVDEFSKEILLNLDYMEELDYIFAKGKLSAHMNAVCASMNTNRFLSLKNARHPLIPRDKCVPLNIEFSDGINGIVITGPNTGGKTVALKTVGLLSVMAQCGLHVPCEEAKFPIFSQVLCDVGDNQSITENLSTFSAHIKNVIEIMKVVDDNSLVLMDELGSGTDPAEGMGIAIAILEELRESHCIFMATTHYSEVKGYAFKTDGLINARMAFDKESLSPLYRLEMGEAGESCALYIAKQLGMPKKMLLRAYHETYQEERNVSVHDLDTSILEDAEELIKTVNHTPIIKMEQPKPMSTRAAKFSLGDSVMVYPDKKLGIVFQTANAKGEVGVMIKKKKVYVNHKRLQLKAAAKDLYPDDYDLSIVFDSVEVRKARHTMGRKHEPGLEIRID